MEISPRNQSIIAQRLALVSLQTIGDKQKPKLSRERVRQIWDKYATPAQKADLTKLTAAVEPADVAQPKDRRAPMVRLHVLMEKKTDLSALDVRHKIAAWLSGKLKVKIPTDEELTERLDIYLPSEMKDALAAKCQSEGVTMGMALSAITRAGKSSKRTKR